MRTTLTLLALVVIPSVAHATPPDVFGYGARTQALGMTGVSYADDYEAVYANPAGLGSQRQMGLALGLQGATFELELDGERFPLDGHQGSTIGLHLPLPFGGPLEDVITIGAGFFTPSSTVLRTDIVFPELPQMAVIARTQSVVLQLGLGLNLDKLVPGLRVGFGVSGLANIGGRLLVEVNEAQQFISQTETQLLASFNPLLGMQLDIGDFTLGLVWRDKVRSDIDLNVELTGLGGLSLPIITITAIPQFDPHMVSLEGAWRNEHWLLALNLSYRRWSQWPGVVGKTTEDSFLPPHPDFRDTISPRLGIEYSATRRRTTAALRFGYAYEMTPAPKARMDEGRDGEGEPRGVQLPIRYLDSDRHILTAGGGTRYRSRVGLDVRFDGFLQLHRMVERTHDIPAPSGTSNMVTSGWILAGGWSIGLDW